MKNSNYKVLFLYSYHEHSMFKFICVVLFNAMHNIIESAINKISWTKLYMLDDHYECTIVYSCDIFLWLFWSKTGPKYTLNCSKSLMRALPPNPPNGVFPLYPTGGFRQPPDPLPRLNDIVSYAPAPLTKHGLKRTVKSTTEFDGNPGPA